MKIEVNINKKCFFAFVLIGLIIVGIVGVIAYGTSTPINFGHSVNEIEWSQIINNITANKFCINTTSGPSCLNNWTGVSTTMGGSQWINGTNGVIYYNITGGKVGIGTSTPNAKLEVVGGSINASGGLIIPTSAPSGTPAVGQMWLVP